MLPFPIYSILPFSLRPSSNCLRLLPRLPSRQSCLLPSFQQNALVGVSYARYDKYSWPFFAFLCVGSSCPSWPHAVRPLTQQKLLYNEHRHSAVIPAYSWQLTASSETQIFLCNIAIYYTGRFIMYSGVKKNYYKKTAGHVFTKPPQIEEKLLNSFPPWKLYFIAVHICAAKRCECMCWENGRSVEEVVLCVGISHE